MIIAQLARFGRETEICDGREGEGTRFEAFGPFVLGFVLEVHFEGFLGEEGEADFCGGGGRADAAGLGGFLALGFH